MEITTENAHLQGESISKKEQELITQLVNIILTNTNTKLVNHIMIMWLSINKVSLKILKNIPIPQLLLHQLRHY